MLWLFVTMPPAHALSLEHKSKGGIEFIKKYNSAIKNSLEKVDTIVIAEYTGECKIHKTTTSGTGDLYEYFFAPLEILKGSQTTNVNVQRSFGYATDPLPEDYCAFYNKGDRYLILAQRIVAQSKTKPSVWYHLVISNSMAISLEDNNGKR